jgi:hypothetical protein
VHDVPLKEEVFLVVMLSCVGYFGWCVLDVGLFGCFVKEEVALVEEGGF